MPVTVRGCTGSFRVVNGYEAPNKKDTQINWDSIIADATIVFLMGIHNIKLISKKLIKIGKQSTTPCAVISKGTTNEQKVIVGTLEDIANKAKEIPTPAIIVVGEVVKLREELKWFEE